MRYYFALPLSVAAGPLGTLLPTPQGAPVASAGVPQALTTGLPRTGLGAVDLAAVATATDDHLAAAPPTQEQTGRDRFGLPVVADAA
jgi:hypothetical protein